MAFIKVQKLVRGDDGEIKSGSAALAEAQYAGVVPGKKGHSKQVIIEKLGKVLYLSTDKKVGIFHSPVRGLVQYDANEGAFSDVELNDPRLPSWYACEEAPVHTVFGDVWFLLQFIRDNGFLDVLRAACSKDAQLQRLVSHLLHEVLKCGSKYSCEDFIAKSFASYFMKGITMRSLKSDSAYYTFMGQDEQRMSYFKAFIAHMRKKHPGFGKACYIDSTPLPNDIADNPFNALCSHGIDSCAVMMRLILILDEETGLPVWYSIIPGNILDISTLQSVLEDVQSGLGITISSLVLDAGYVTKDLLKLINRNTEEKQLIARMPARKYFPHDELYEQVKPVIHDARYSFIRAGHSYFGLRCECDVLGSPEFCYVYVDFPNALRAVTNYRMSHAEAYDKLTAEEKNWYSVKYGFFILVSNIETTPEDLIDRYYGRTEIETVFKTAKTYLNILPISKWTDAAVRGKILSDVIATTVYLLVRKELSGFMISMTEFLGKLSSVMCFKNKEIITVEPPSKKVKDFLLPFGLKVPPYEKISTWEKLLKVTV